MTRYQAKCWLVQFTLILSIVGLGYIAVNNATASRYQRAADIPDSEIPIPATKPIMWELR